MIFERLENFTVDIEKLQRHLLDSVIPFAPPVMLNDHFGGWSVFSAEGTYKDGWQSGHSCLRQEGSRMVFDEELAKQIGLKPILEYKKPTEICTGYLLEVMTRLEELKLYPRRARISLIAPGGETIWHYDGPKEEYSVRLHIPILTNEHCFFATEEGNAHLPADGSAYLLRVNRLHRAVNHGMSDRYHLIADVWDVDHISQFHRYLV